MAFTYGNGVAGATNKYTASAVALLDQREIYNQLIDIQDDAEWLDFMYMAGKKDATAVPFYTSFYNDNLYKLLTVSGTPTGTTTIPLITLSAADYNFVLVGDLLKFPSGAVGRVQEKQSSSIIKVQSVSGTALAASLAAMNGVKLSAFSNAQEEGSVEPGTRRWSVNSLQNRVQIFRNAIKITDVQNASKIELEFNGKPYILPYEMIQGLQKHRGDISLAMWLGEVSNTLFADVDGPTATATPPYLQGETGYGVQTTRGMDSYITNYGINDSVTTAGTFTLSDLSDLEAQLTAVRAPMEYMIAGSNPAVAVISDFLKNLPSSGTTITTNTLATPIPPNTATTVANNGYYRSGVNSGVLSVNGREIDLQAEKFMHGGYTYNLKAFKVLSNTDVINYTGGPIAKSIYFLPMGKVKTVGGGMNDYFRYKYMAQPAPGTGSVETAELMTGALAPTPTNQEQSLTVSWTSNMGLEVFAPNKFAKISNILA
jgi:hypothetical protein